MAYQIIRAIDRKCIFETEYKECWYSDETIRQMESCGLKALVNGKIYHPKAERTKRREKCQ